MRDAPALGDERVEKKQQGPQTRDFLPRLRTRMGIEKKIKGRNRRQTVAALAVEGAVVWRYPFANRAAWQPGVQGV